jgi:hypothetical protein
MIALLKNTILNNLTIKIFSLIIGYCLWSFLGRVYLQINTIQVPICFYNVPCNREISAYPESIEIQIRGKRSDLRQCSDLALHIDAQSLALGEHKISPEDDQLFLPKTVTMIHYKPHMINLLVTEKII